MESQVPAPYTSGTLLAPITFQRESLTDALILELGPLLREHYEEIATYQDIPLDPDWPKYFALQTAGIFRVFTSRAENGELLGYNAYFIKNNLHYRSSKVASNDVIFISKSRRGFGRDFITFCDEQLRAEGVQCTTHHIKAVHDWSKILERMGYLFMDKLMVKRLDL